MLTLAGCMLAAACSKENNGLLELSAEGYGSAAKTSVSGLTVQWESGDQVRLNSNTYSVSVSDGKAYVNSSLSGEVYGWSPASLVGATWNRSLHVLSFTFPSEYTCTYSAGRQKIDLPMAAYASSASDGVCFRHLSAGIRVLTTNLTEQALVLDSVVVSSALYKLSGYVTATLADDAAPAIEAESGSGRVVVRMGEDVSLAASHADTVEVQVPIRPIGEGDLTIEVYAHRRGDAVSISGVPTVYKSVRYHFSGTHSSSALGRNVLLTAGVRLGESTPSEEVDHSLVYAQEKMFLDVGNKLIEYLQIFFFGHLSKVILSSSGAGFGVSGGSSCRKASRSLRTRMSEMVFNMPSFNGKRCCWCSLSCSRTTLPVMNLMWR